MVNYPYKKIGANLEKDFRKNYNENMENIEGDIKRVDNQVSEALSILEEAKIQSETALRKVEELNRLFSSVKNAADKARIDATAALTKAKDSDLQSQNTQAQINNLITNTGELPPQDSKSFINAKEETLDTLKETLDNKDFKIEYTSNLGTNDKNSLVGAINESLGRIDVLQSFRVNLKNYTSVATANNDDWGKAINQALSELPNGRGTIIIPRGGYYIKTPITLKRGQVLVGEGSDSTILYIQTHTGIYVTEQLVTLRDFTLRFSREEDKFNYTGIDFSASRSYMENVHISSPKIGIRFNNASYYNLINSLYIYKADQYGILFERSGGDTSAFDPNNHSIHLKQISGNDRKKGSIGIYIKEGAVNNIYGGEVQSFDTNIKIQTHNNRLYGLYLEDSNWDLDIVNETNFIDVQCGRIKSGNEADIINTAGGYTKYFDVPPQRPSVKSLRGLYLFNEGNGNIIRDYSGNHKDASVIGGGSWTSGLYGSALQLDSSLSEKINIPPDIINPTQPYTFAVLFNTQLANLYNNQPLILLDNLKYLRFQRTGDYKTEIYSYNGTNMSRKTLNSNMSTRIDKWTWLFMTYDPITGVLESLDPVNPFKTTITNPLSMLTKIEVHKSNGEGHSWVAKYNIIAFWQRKLTRSEARQFINSVQPIIPVNALMRKPRNFGGYIDTQGAEGNVVNVVFSTPELDTNYFVSITLTGKTGTAPSGVVVESIRKTKLGFSFTLNQAPGINNSYSFDWVITRNQ